MEAPEISTLGPDDEDEVIVPVHTAQPIPSSQMSKFRVNKIKLRVPDRSPTYDASAVIEAELRSDAEDEEEDQLIDDDLGLGPGPSVSTAVSKPKRARPRKPKVVPVSLHLPPPTAEPVGNDNASDVGGAAPSSTVPDPAATMMSAWQVEVPAVTPQPGGTTGDVWDVQAPSKVIKRKPLKKSTPIAVTRSKRVVPKRLDEGSGGEGTPSPFVITPAEPHREITLEDVQKFVESGELALAPTHPLSTRPFAVQPIPKTSSAYASSGPLERSTRKPRKWRIVHREIKTIAGRRWIGRTWTGDKESELMVPLPSVVPLATDGGSAGASGSPAKHPKIKFTRPKDVPRTRDPSIDTEMLSLAGEMEAEIDNDNLMMSTHLASVSMRDVDAEMESFLGD